LNEINLAKGFFTREVEPHSTDKLIVERLSNHLCAEKTVAHFFDYEYDNGNPGFYPV